MKKFKFNLESVLRYRKHIELQKKQEVALAIRNFSDCDKRLSNVKKEYSKLRTAFDGHMEKGISGDRHTIFTDSLETLGFDIDSTQRELIKLKKEISDKKKVLLSKQKERKLIDKLKERKKALFFDAMTKLEQKEMDDMVILKKARDKL